MASEELQSSCEAVEKAEDSRREMGSDNTNNHNNTTETKKKKKKKKKASSYMPIFGCFRSGGDEYYGDGSFDMEAAATTTADHSPRTHLVVMVHGIVGSAQDLRFTAKQFVKNYPNNVTVHCSECNSTMLTFDGVDIMGKRLADEVISVIKCHPDLQKISFIGHSLGGLIARYAIAGLYGQDSERTDCEDKGEYGLDGSKDTCLEEKCKGKIAGLEPVNFITVATPHLGSRGHKQVPLVCGFYTLEKVASRTSWFLGRTGKHLFLTDHDDGKPPLLLQMVNDCEGLQFISALQSFRRRVAYANARFDYIVGWSTSSLRRQNELPKRQQLSRIDKYPHIVNVETAKASNHQEVVLLEGKVNRYKTDDMEEVMIRSLTKLSWERVDVKFSGSRQKYIAHSTIQVINYCTNSDGADVVQHMVDNFLL